MLLCAGIAVCGDILHNETVMAVSLNNAFISHRWRTNALVSGAYVRVPLFGTAVRNYTIRTRGNTASLRPLSAELS